MKIANNSLLLVLFGVAATYWSMGWYIPGILLSGTVSVFSILIGLAVLWRYSTGVYEVLILGKRSIGDDNAHYAALGIPAIAAGVVYSGVYNLIWNWMDTPQAWVGTPVSNFGRVLMALGFVGLFFSPDATRHRITLSTTAWAISILLTAIVVAFLMGASLGNETPAVRRFLYGVHFPVCSKSQNVLGTAGKIYHTVDSPWRALIKPEACFADEGEARRAGFRPPRLNFRAPPA